MAEQKLAMSLDALIAQVGKDKKPPRPKREPRPALAAPTSGPRKGLARNKRGGGNNANGVVQQQQQQQVQQQPRPKPAPVQQQVQQQVQPQQRRPPPQTLRRTGAPNLGVRSGQVQKRQVLEVPVHALRQQPVLPPYPRPVFQQQRQPAPEGKWEHDLFHEYPAPRRAPVQVAVATSFSTKLIVKNLHHNVTRDDLLELFSTCGKVIDHGINYDRSDRSLGTGWVSYETRAEAVRAKKEYNGVLLDNQAMDITFSDEASGNLIKQLSSGVKVQKPAGAGAAPAGAANGSSRPAEPGQRLAAAALRGTAAAARSGGGRGGVHGRTSGRLRSAVVQANGDGDFMQE